MKEKWTYQVMGYSPTDYNLSVIRENESRTIYQIWSKADPTWRDSKEAFEIFTFSSPVYRYTTEKAAFKIIKAIMEIKGLNWSPDDMT